MPEAGARRLLSGDPWAGVHVLRAAEAQMFDDLAPTDAARYELLPSDEGVPAEAHSWEAG